MSTEVYVRWEIRSAASVASQIQKQLEEEKKRSEIRNAAVIAAQCQRRLEAEKRAFAEKAPHMPGLAEGGGQEAYMRGNNIEMGRVETAEGEALAFGDVCQAAKTETTSRQKGVGKANWAEMLKAADTVGGSKKATDDMAEEWGAYLALISLLNRPTPDEGGMALTAEGLKAEIAKLKAEYTRKQEANHVYANLKEVFFELGLEIGDEYEMENLSGRLLYDSNIEGCAIFLCEDSDGFLLETVAEANPEEGIPSCGSARIQEAAEQICEKHRLIVERMRMRGIDLFLHGAGASAPEKIRISGETASGKRRRKRANAARMDAIE